MSGVTGRAGPNWERIVADYAAARGLPWDRAPLRGTRDLLDLQGTLPAGFLVGCKAIRRTSYIQWREGERAKGRLGDDLTLEDAYQAGVSAGRGKISEAMKQCDRAMDNLARYGNGRLLGESAGVIPVQVMQRSGFPAGKAYAVTQYDHLLDLALERAKGRAEQ